MTSFICWSAFGLCGRCSDQCRRFKAYWDARELQCQTRCTFSFFRSVAFAVEDAMDRDVAVFGCQPAAVVEYTEAQ